MFTAIICLCFRMLTVRRVTTIACILGFLLMFYTWLTQGTLDFFALPSNNLIVSSEAKGSNLLHQQNCTICRETHLETQIWNTTSIQNSRNVANCPLSFDNNSSPYPHQGLNILLFTAFRSGSSFTGEMFKQNPTMLYLFEPFKLMDIAPGSPKHKETIKLCFQQTLHDLFSCRFGSINKYAMENFKPRTVNFWHKRVFTKLRHTTVPIVEALQRQCMFYKHRAIKTIRGTEISSVWHLIEPGHGSEYRARNRILYLVRDPRGVVSSRLKVNQVQVKQNNFTMFVQANRHKFLNEADLLCRQYTANLDFLQSAISPTSAKSFHLIRYEDIAYDPVGMVKKIYSFLGIPLHPRVLFWYKMTTGVEHKDAVDTLRTLFNTVRNSGNTAEAWRKYIPYDLAEAMDSKCAQALRLLGYSRVVDVHTYTNSSFTYVKDLPFKFGLT